jgi:hypothetical protein
MADLKYKDGTTATIIDTGLNSLANNSLAASAAQDNSADLDLYADLEIVVSGFGASINQGTAYLEIYLCPSVDGSNYPDGHDASVTPAGSALIGMAVKATANGSGALRNVITGIPLPPRQFKVVVKNTSGQALAGSGNTVKIRKYKLQSV